MADPVETQESEEGQASDAQGEVLGGTEHFSIGDDPPGLDSLETKSDQPPDEVSEDSQEAPRQDAAAAAPAEPFFRFKTADDNEKVFNSAEEAQHFFSSWNGRLSKAERELNDAVQKNLQWQRSYEDGSLIEHYQKTKAPAKPAGEEKPATQAEVSALKSVDWNEVTKLLRSGKSDEALQYITYANGVYLKQQVDGIRKEFEDKLHQSFEEREAPSRFQEEVSNAISYVAESAYNAVNDMGEPLFPEFQDGPKYDKAFVSHFRDIWLNQELNYAVDPNLTGFRAAYYEAKATYRPKPAAPPQGGQAAAAATSAASTPRNPDGTFAKRNAALAMSDGEAASPRMGSGIASREAQILEGMRNAGTPVSKHFNVLPD